MAACVAHHPGSTDRPTNKEHAIPSTNDPMELANHIENEEDRYMFYLSCIAAYEFLGYDTPAASQKIHEEYERYGQSPA